jgi:hypothetical protein
MMIRLPADGNAKDISEYITKADKVFNFGDDSEMIKKFVLNLNLENGKFVWN